MLYRICAASIWENTKNKEAKKLLSEYPCLNNFGWKLVEYVDNQHTRIRDENGKWIYQVIPKTDHRPYIEINSLEELQKLQAAVEHPLIFTEDEIEIYDDYRE